MHKRHDTKHSPAVSLLARLTTTAVTIGVLLSPVPAAAQSVSELYLASRVARKLTQDDRARQALLALTYASTMSADGFHIGPQPISAGSPITGGGKVPANLGAPTDDGYGSALGYCAWDNGSSTSSAGFLAGSNSMAAVTISVVSPGLDGIIQTSCSDIQAGTFPRADDSVQTVRAGQLASGLVTSKAVGDAVAATADLAALPSDVPLGQVRYVMAEKTFYAKTATGWEKTAAGPFVSSLTNPATAFYSSADYTLKVGHDGDSQNGRLSVAGVSGGHNLVLHSAGGVQPSSILFDGGGGGLSASIQHTAGGPLKLSNYSAPVELLSGDDDIGAGLQVIHDPISSDVSAVLFAAAGTKSAIGLTQNTLNLYSAGSILMHGPSIVLRSTTNQALSFESTAGAVFNGPVTAPAFIGNASSATRLETARLINGVAFDGTANITVADSTKLPLTGGTVTGALATNGTFSSLGRITGNAGITINDGMTLLKTTPTGIAGSAAAVSFYALDDITLSVSDGGPAARLQLNTSDTQLTAPANLSISASALTAVGTASARFSSSGVTKVDGNSLTLQSNNNTPIQFLSTGGATFDGRVVINSTLGATVNGQLNVNTHPGGDLTAAGLQLNASGTLFSIAASNFAGKSYSAITSRSATFTVDVGGSNYGLDIQPNTTALSSWGTVAISASGSALTLSGKTASLTSTGNTAIVFNSTGGGTFNGPLNLTGTGALSNILSKGDLTLSDTSTNTARLARFENSAGWGTVGVTASGSLALSQASGGNSTTISSKATGTPTISLSTVEPGKNSTISMTPTAFTLGTSGTMTIIAGSGLSIAAPSGATFSGAVTATSFIGNATSATKLATARKINGVDFDGTSDITINGSDNTKLPLAGGTLTGELIVNAPLTASVSDADGQATLWAGSGGASLSHDSGTSFGSVSANNGFAQFYTSGGGGNFSRLAVYSNSISMYGKTIGVSTDSFDVYGDISGSGNAVFSGNLTAATVTQTSDERLKTGIRSLAPSELTARFMAARPVNYVLNSTGRQDFGFVAQEMLDIFPELVYQNANGYYSFSYSGMVPILTSVVQEQQRNIQKLKETKLDSLVDQWVRSSEGADRMYFAKGGTTMLKGYGDNVLEVRNGDDKTIAQFTKAGDLAIMNNLRWMGGAALGSSSPDEIAVRSMSPTRAALRLEVANGTGALASRVLGYLFGDSTGVGLADATGRAVLTAGSRADGSPLVTISGDMDVVSGKLGLGSKSTLFADADGWINVAAPSGLRIGAPGEKALFEVSAKGAVRAKRLEATDVVDTYSSCAGQQAQIARDAQGQVVVCQ